MKSRTGVRAKEKMLQTALVDILLPDLSHDHVAQISGSSMVEKNGQSKVFVLIRLKTMTGIEKKMPMTYLIETTVFAAGFTALADGRGRYMFRQSTKHDRNQHLPCSLFSCGRTTSR